MQEVVDVLERDHPTLEPRPEEERVLERYHWITARTLTVDFLGDSGRPQGFLVPHDPLIFLNF